MRAAEVGAVNKTIKFGEYLASCGIYMNILQSLFNAFGGNNESLSVWFIALHLIDRKKAWGQFTNHTVHLEDFVCFTSKKGYTITKCKTEG